MREGEYQKKLNAIRRLGKALKPWWDAHVKRGQDEAEQYANRPKDDRRPR